MPIKSKKVAKKVSYKAPKKATKKVEKPLPTPCDVPVADNTIAGVEKVSFMDAPMIGIKEVITPLTRGEIAKATKNNPTKGSGKFYALIPNVSFKNLLVDGIAGVFASRSEAIEFSALSPKGTFKLKTIHLTAKILK